jgi:predicted RNase H-like HicB family nuclease
MTTTPMPHSVQDPDPPRQRKPIPAAVATLVAAVRDVFRKAEDDHAVEHGAGHVTDKRQWNLDFVVEPDDLDGGFVAECPQLPGAMAQGETEQEALAALGEVVEGIVALRVKHCLQHEAADIAPRTSIRIVSIPLN